MVNEIEKQISEGRLEQLRSLAYQLSPEAQEINKGIIDDLNRKEEGQLNSTKKGLDIREKLMGILASCKVDKETMMTAMAECVNKIGIIPEDKNSSYEAKRYKHALGGVPKVYSYSQKYPMQDNPAPAENHSHVAKDMSSKMQEYNNMARDYVDKCVEVLKMESAIKNIKDSKSYVLSIDVTAKLGF